MDIEAAAALVTPEAIERRLTSWSESEWDMNRENYFEYRAACGEEATKTFREFAWGIAAQNLLFDALQRGEAAHA